MPIVGCRSVTTLLCLGPSVADDREGLAMMQYARRQTVDTAVASAIQIHAGDNFFNHSRNVMCLDCDKCAEQWKMCDCFGQIRYGDGAKWSEWRDSDGDVKCSNDVFGDSAPGKVKFCACQEKDDQYDKGAVDAAWATDKAHDSEPTVRAACDASGACKGYFRESSSGFYYTLESGKSAFDLKEPFVRWAKAKKQWSHAPSNQTVRLAKTSHAVAQRTESGEIIVSSCELASAADAESDWEKKYQEAIRPLCKNPAMRPLMRLTVDPKFEKQFQKFYDADGWIDKAWVNYIGVKGPNDMFGMMTRALAESTKRASAHPLVVVDFGEIPITDVPSEEFPNVVLLRAAGLPKSAHLSFNFNKLRAIVLARVKTGASLDSDMIMVQKRGDLLLKRTAEEITEAYPFPMMPTHFLDRDPRDKDQYPADGGNYLIYDCPSCPDATMRWGQAQPTWTYWSLPFVSEWLYAKMTKNPIHGVDVEHIGEDEDLLNVGLWSAGANKSWCSFQQGGGMSTLKNLVSRRPSGSQVWYADPHYFKKGIPVAYFFFHGIKEYDVASGHLEFLRKESGVDEAPSFEYGAKAYESFSEVLKADPDLRCIL